MISTQNISLAYGKRVLFKDVNIKFTPGNCYGVIGANGAGKSTFLKILSGELEPDTGQVQTGDGERIAVLQQDHFAYDSYSVLDAVIKGYEKLYQVRKQKDEIYMKEDFSEEDGIRAAELESEFAEMGGWESEAEAAVLLSGLGVEESLHEKAMADLDETVKIRVLLAQALFGNPDVLLLDEPTNHLDLESITWLEDFLYRFANTVIVVSHDRHFLNKVCTHIADIDYSKIQLFVGNYDFWYQSSLLARKQQREQQKKQEDKAQELKAFIQRFSSNAAKAKQATARKKMLEKLTVSDIKPSSRRFPYVAFNPERSCGKMILEAQGLTLERDGEKLLDNFSFSMNQGDKIAFAGPQGASKTALFEILSGRVTPDAGTFRWGETITVSYFPKDNTEFFASATPMNEWLGQFTEEDDASYIRGFLGRMLFSGDEALKPVNVLSGGERVRCMLSRMMLSGANALILDEPTSHLDLESITALNNGLIDFSGVLLMSSHDHQFVKSTANRIIEFTPGGVIDRMSSLDDYMENAEVNRLRDKMYHGHNRITI